MIGRLVSVDPILNARAAAVDPQRWGRYVYARDNPLRFIDRDGRDVIEWLTGVANAINSNFFGVERLKGSGDLTDGQTVGDVASIVLGGVEAALGGSMAGPGTVTVVVGTGGVGVVAAPATITAGVGMIAHGAAGTVMGAVHLMESHRDAAAQALAEKLSMAEAKANGGEAYHARKDQGPQVS